jgi:hypothetical protein
MLQNIGGSWWRCPRCARAIQAQCECCEPPACGCPPPRMDEQARRDATVYRCLECELDISGATRLWHQRQGHPTVGPIERDSTQSRLDADADAETAARNGLGWSMAALALDPDALSQYEPAFAGVLTRTAAHAAFCAVPGLRGA